MGRVAIDEFRSDPRQQDTPICIVADLEVSPIDDPDVRFVRGMPFRREVLEKAAAARASFAIVLATDPNDHRADEDTALTIHTLRRLNPEIHLSAELVDSRDRDLLKHAGCDAIVDMKSMASLVMIRSVRDAGVTDVVHQLLSSQFGCEIVRATIPREFVGRSYRDYATAMIARRISVLGVLRDGQIDLNPDPSISLTAEDNAFVITRDVLGTS